MGVEGIAPPPKPCKGFILLLDNTPESSWQDSNLQSQVYKTCAIPD